MPRRQFLAERDRAFAADTATGGVLLDASDAMGMGYPATTPLLVARCLVLRKGAPLAVNRIASAELIYVFHGKGASEGCGESVAWAAARAIRLSSQQMEPAGCPVPTMNVASTLRIQGQGVYSLIED